MERRKHTERPRIADESVEPAPAAVKRLAKPIDRVPIAQVDRHECRGFLAGPQRLDLVVQFLERALRAGERHDMRACAGESEGRGATDAARGAGHQNDARRRSPGCIDIRPLNRLSCCSLVALRQPAHRAHALGEQVAPACLDGRRLWTCRTSK